jgi:hypothetical protein
MQNTRERRCRRQSMNDLFSKSNLQTAAWACCVRALMAYGLSISVLD